MKRIVLASLSVLSLSTLMATSAVAETRTMQQKMAAATISNQATPAQLSPVSLVSLAYQGQFREQGIPGYAGLLNAHTAGRVSAEALIQAAIAEGKLSSTILSDRDYVQIVASELMSLSKN